ncbi:MAG: hypothetical protein NXY57DRAFT_967175 [Lentinula lateritia]|nr:MAG: hypothetical protein NXY57DRAFT_967175 [Lentinula lateritia]
MSKSGQFSMMSDDQFRHVISQNSNNNACDARIELVYATTTTNVDFGTAVMQNQTQQNQTQTWYQHYQIPQPQLQSQPPAVAPVAPVIGTPISSSAQCISQVMLPASEQARRSSFNRLYSLVPPPPPPLLLYPSPPPPHHPPWEQQHIPR